MSDKQQRKYQRLFRRKPEFMHLNDAELEAEISKYEKEKEAHRLSYLGLKQEIIEGRDAYVTRSGRKIFWTGDSQRKIAVILATGDCPAFDLDKYTWTKDENGDILMDGLLVPLRIPRALSNFVRFLDERSSLRSMMERVDAIKKELSLPAEKVAPAGLLEMSGDDTGEFANALSQIWNQ